MLDLSGKNLHELCELLVDKTVKLLKAIDQKQTSGADFQELKNEVETVQLAIKSVSPVK